MAKISKGQISAYIRTGEPLDKAGAFAAQGKGAVFIKRIRAGIDSSFQAGENHGKFWRIDLRGKIFLIHILDFLWLHVLFLRIFRKAGFV